MNSVAHALELKRRYDRTPWVKISPHWYRTIHTDEVARALFAEHYSCKKQNPNTVCSAGERLVFIREDALLVWQHHKFRADKQEGAYCSIFRNTGAVLSSTLLNEAMELIWKNCPRIDRMYTFIDPSRVASRNPGYCFKVCGWKTCGVTKKGLLIMEALRPATENKPSSLALDKTNNV